ncbi:DUF350 domain-containing protein [bacterium]|nr:DUF350 domain-containing protein [bacterium]
MAKKVMKFGFAIAILLVGIASVVSAQVSREAGEAIRFLSGWSLLNGIVGTVVYSALGLAVLLIGFKIFDIVTPFSLNREIAEDNNVAAGVVVAGIMIALGIIVAAAII